MQLGMIGLGRMGDGMTERLAQAGHEREDLRPAGRSTAARSTSCATSSTRRARSG